MTTPLRILHDQDGLVVVDKPPDRPTTGRTLDDPDGVQHALMEQLRRRPLWAVHQLDRETSGVNLFVRRKALVELWAGHLKAGRKVYVAICHGVPGPVGEPVEVDAPLGWIEATRRQGVTADGRAAQSTFLTLQTAGPFALVLVRIATGRTHQVRLHLEHLGCALVGERRYREPPCELHPRQALHALVVDCGAAGLFAAGIPRDLLELAARLGLEAGLARVQAGLDKLGLPPVNLGG